jgi:hypothetical protein
MEYNSFFEPNNKHRRVLDDITLTDTSLGGVDDEKTEPMSRAELLDIGYKGCFACDNMHAKAIEENENYSYLMKLYTANSANICKDSIYTKIFEYFQNTIVPDLIEIREHVNKHGDDAQLAGLPTTEWSLDSIKEHFDIHTSYPTDEILFQMRLKKATRNKLSDNIVEKRPDGTLKFNHKNLDAVMKLDKAILDLMKTRKDINTMAGYSRELDY